MMSKRHTLCLPLAAALVALLSASAFAVAPIIDELPRVVIAAGTTTSNPVNLDAYIDWFPVTNTAASTETYGANRDYPGHASKAPGYGTKSRFHVYVSEPTAGRTLTGSVTGAPLTVLQNAALAPVTGQALPAVATEQYGVDPYSGPKTMSLTYTAVPAVQTTAKVDVFAVVEGEMDGSKLVADYAQMTVITGATKTATGFGIQLVSGRANDSFKYWIPRVREGSGYTNLPPRGQNNTDIDTVAAGLQTSWMDKSLRNAGSIIGWDTTGFLPTAPNLTVGTYTAAARGATAAYANFIPANGGGTGTLPVFQVKARFVSSGSAAVESPGYRVSYMNGAQTHSGTFQVLDDVSSLPYGYKGTGPGQRTNGHDFVARAVFATPYAMTEMGDTGRISSFGAGFVVDGVDPADPVLIGADGRDYGLEIMCIAKWNSVGEFILDSLSVTSFDDSVLVPTGVSKEWTGATLTASTWGAGQYSAAYVGEGKIESNAVLLWGARDARTNVNANTSTLGTYRISKASPSVAGGGIPVVSNTLYRMTYTVQSGGVSGNGDTSLSPVMVLHTMIFPTNYDLTHAVAMNIFEFYGPQAPYIKDPLVRPAGAPGPGVPPGTPASIRSYAWSHTLPAAPAGQTWIAVPEIVVYNTGWWHTLGQAWKDANGYYKFTGVKMEQIGNIF